MLRLSAKSQTLEVKLSGTLRNMDFPYPKRNLWGGYVSLLGKQD